jgi:Putative polyhydroxyalkanoic acid system protein (PHA_gran_rgn)
MQFDFSYSLSKQEARERLGVLGEYLFNRHGIGVTWDGDTASFDGKYLLVQIVGKMTLSEGALHFEGKDPGMLWRRKATSYLKDKLEIYLDPRTPVAELARDKQ